ncbi:MAG: 2-oxoacid:acceptor oxidoreductase subunit alpha [Bacteroidetes bacterium]|nr:MAG: 2-oxoacid:acceptor oxidoreductase subunit alpha [Bacteroidota bacterium]
MKHPEIIQKQDVVILFAGDSGDGMQLTGTQFTNTNALFGNDVSTFPNFPAEIRAPQGTLPGVSGFQLHFGAHKLYTPGDQADVLIAMNAAALITNISKLKKGGIIIANTAGFDAKNLRLAKAESNPLENGSLSNYIVYAIDITKLSKEALKDSGLGTKEIDRSKNMFVLGLLCWMYDRSLQTTEQFLKEKFAHKPHILEANIKVLHAGYYFGETSEIFTRKYEVEKAKLPKGTYRNIVGNQATAIGLIAASQKADLKLFYGSYPITPASDILHELAKHKNFDVYTFQAEDEIAAVCSAIGASYGGNIGVTGSSGPGIALKMEAIGLAVMLELPLVVLNIQRGGPSTGLPTKTEQADLFQVMYGRNGEAPAVVIAANTPADCFYMAFEAVKLSLEHMTPVFFMSDGYLANGSEPWKFPKSSDLPEIQPPFANPEKDYPYYPYQRDEKLVRKWAVPGMKNLMHRIGGLEKEDVTGNVSYDPQNHEKMVKIRAEKVAKIADFIPLQKIECGKEKGKVLVLGWGSTYGAIKTAVSNLTEEGYEVGHTHLKYLNPMPKNLEEILRSFDKVLVPEMNNGQLVQIIRSKFLIDAIPFNKIQGIPFSVSEIENKVKEIYHAN